MPFKTVFEAVTGHHIM